MQIIFIMPVWIRWYLVNSFILLKKIQQNIENNRFANLFNQSVCKLTNLIFEQGWLPGQLTASIWRLFLLVPECQRETECIAENSEYWGTLKWEL